MMRDNPALPLLAATMGIAIFSAMDGVMKVSSLAIGAYMAMVIRTGFGVALMLPLWRWRGGRWPTGAMLRLHGLRGGVSAAMSVSFFWGLVRTPLAEAIALSFIAPLIALYLAAVMLGERIARAAVIAALLGLAGVVVIAAGRLADAPLVGAGDREAGWGIVSVLLSAVLYAWNLVLQRQQAQGAGSVEVAAFQSLFVGVFLALALPWLGAPVALAALPALALAAVMAVAALMLLSWAYARAETQLLLPVEYTAFIWAALIGRQWFGEPLGLATLLGVALIVLGCWIGTRGLGAAHVEPTAC